MMRLLLLLTLITTLHCSTGHNPPSGPPVHVTFENQSQFEIEGLYVHDDASNYQTQPQRLTKNLAPQATIDFDIPSGFWYITVLRKPNKDTSALAYTTAMAWDVSKYKKLIYFDEQFRTGN